jgi:signal peptidase I
VVGLACRSAGGGALPNAQKMKGTAPASHSGALPAKDSFQMRQMAADALAACHIRCFRATLWQITVKYFVDAVEISDRKPGWLQVILIGRRPRATLARILVLSTVCFVTFRFVLIPIRVSGISMEPTYHDRRVDCVNRLAYVFHEPQRGDVISIRFSQPQSWANPSEMLMKRIIALPGETIAFHDGHAYINGQPLEEPYLKNPCEWEHGPILCGPTQYYVVGDNRSMPFGDHKQGRVERDHIVGKVL